MQTRVADRLDGVGTPIGQAVTYRVRAWNRGPLTWLVDEWDVTEAADVQEVLDWAKDLGSDSVEKYLQSEDHVQDRSGALIARKRFTRIYGHPADEDQASETVEFMKP